MYTSPRHARVILAHKFMRDVSKLADEKMNRDRLFRPLLREEHKRRVHHPSPLIIKIAATTAEGDMSQLRSVDGGLCCFCTSTKCGSDCTVEALGSVHYVGEVSSSHRKAGLPFSGWSG